MDAWSSVSISDAVVGARTYGLAIADLDAASDAAQISGECILPDGGLNLRGSVGEVWKDCEASRGHHDSISLCFD